MRKAITLLFDVAVSITLFLVGTCTHNGLGLGTWFAPVSLLPCFVWFGWRGAVSRELLRSGILFVGVFSAYLAVKDIAWPNAPDWSCYVDALFNLACLCCIDGLSRRVTRADHREGHGA